MVLIPTVKVQHLGYTVTLDSIADDDAAAFRDQLIGTFWSYSDIYSKGLNGESVYLYLGQDGRTDTFKNSYLSPNCGGHFVFGEFTDHDVAEDNYCTIEYVFNRYGLDVHYVRSAQAQLTISREGYVVTSEYTASDDRTIYQDSTGVYYLVTEDDTTTKVYVNVEDAYEGNGIFSLYTGESEVKIEGRAATYSGDALTDADFAGFGYEKPNAGGTWYKVDGYEKGEYIVNVDDNGTITLWQFDIVEEVNNYSGTPHSMEVTYTSQYKYHDVVVTVKPSETSDETYRVTYRDDQPIDPTQVTYTDGVTLNQVYTPTGDYKWYASPRYFGAILLNTYYTCVDSLGTHVFCSLYGSTAMTTTNIKSDEAWERNTVTTSTGSMLYDGNTGRFAKYDDYYGGDVYFTIGTANGRPAIIVTPSNDDTYSFDPVYLLKSEEDPSTIVVEHEEDGVAESFTVVEYNNDVTLYYYMDGADGSYAPDGTVIVWTPTALNTTKKVVAGTSFFLVNVDGTLGNRTDWSDAYGSLQIVEESGSYSITRYSAQPICQQMTGSEYEGVTQVEGQAPVTITYDVSTDDGIIKETVQVKYLYTEETEGDTIVKHYLVDENNDKLHYNPNVCTKIVSENGGSSWVLRPGAVLEGEDPEVIILGLVKEESGLKLAEIALPSDSIVGAERESKNKTGYQISEGLYVTKSGWIVTYDPKRNVGGHPFSGVYNGTEYKSNDIAITNLGHYGAPEANDPQVIIYKDYQYHGASTNKPQSIWLENLSNDIAMDPFGNYYTVTQNNDGDVATLVGKGSSGEPVIVAEPIPVMGQNNKIEVADVPFSPTTVTYTMPNAGSKTLYVLEGIDGTASAGLLYYILPDAHGVFLTRVGSNGNLDYVEWSDGKWISAPATSKLSAKESGSVYAIVDVTAYTDLTLTIGDPKGSVLDGDPASDDDTDLDARTGAVTVITATDNNGNVSGFFGTNDNPMDVVSYEDAVFKNAKDKKIIEKDTYIYVPELEDDPNGNTRSDFTFKEDTVVKSGVTLRVITQDGNISGPVLSAVEGADVYFVTNQDRTQVVDGSSYSYEYSANADAQSPGDISFTTIRVENNGSNRGTIDFDAAGSITLAETLLGISSDVAMTAGGAISFNDIVTVSDQAKANELNLTAGQDIRLNSITAQHADVALVADGSVLMRNGKNCDYAIDPDGADGTYGTRAFVRVVGDTAEDSADDSTVSIAAHANIGSADNRLIVDIPAHITLQIPFAGNTYIDALELAQLVPGTAGSTPVLADSAFDLFNGEHVLYNFYVTHGDNPRINEFKAIDADNPSESLEPNIEGDKLNHIGDESGTGVVFENMTPEELAAWIVENATTVTGAEAGAEANWKNYLDRDVIVALIANGNGLTDEEVAQLLAAGELAAMLDALGFDSTKVFVADALTDSAEILDGERLTAVRIILGDVSIESLELAGLQDQLAGIEQQIEATTNDTTLTEEQRAEQLAALTESKAQFVDKISQIQVRIWRGETVDIVQQIAEVEADAALTEEEKAAQLAELEAAKAELLSQIAAATAELEAELDKVVAQIAENEAQELDTTELETRKAKLEGRIDAIKAYSSDALWASKEQIADNEAAIAQLVADETLTEEARVEAIETIKAGNRTLFDDIAAARLERAAAIYDGLVGQVDTAIQTAFLTDLLDVQLADSAQVAVRDLATLMYSLLTEAQKTAAHADAIDKAGITKESIEAGTATHTDGSAFSANESTPNDPAPRAFNVAYGTSTGNVNMYNDGDINITVTEASDLIAQNIVSQRGDVSIDVADGSIIAGALLEGEQAHIVAEDISLKASGDIGSATAPVRVDEMITDTAVGVTIGESTADDLAYVVTTGADGAIAITITLDTDLSYDWMRVDDHDVATRIDADGANVYVTEVSGDMGIDNVSATGHAELVCNTGDVVNVLTNGVNVTAATAKVSAVNGAIGSKDDRLVVNISDHMDTISRDDTFLEAKGSLDLTADTITTQAEIDAVVSAQTALDETLDRIDALEGELIPDKQNEIATLDEQIPAKQAEADEKKAEVVENAAALAELKAQLAAKEAELAELTAQAGAKQDEVDALNIQIEELNAKGELTVEEQAQLEALTGERNAAAAELSELSGAVEAADLERQDLDAQVQALETMRAELARLIAALDTMKSGRDAAAAELDALTAELAEKQAALPALEYALAHAKGELVDELYVSAENDITVANTEASGGIDIDADGNIAVSYVPGDLIIGTIEAGGTVDITAEKNVLFVNGAVVENAHGSDPIVGDTINLTAKNGTVGTDFSPAIVNTAAGNAKQGTLSASGATVYAVEQTDDLVIGKVVASAGDATIIAPGSITDAGGSVSDPSVIVTGGDLNLFAGGAIGVKGDASSPRNSLDTQVEGTTYITAEDDVTISETGDMLIGSYQTADGMSKDDDDATFSASGDIVSNVTIHADAAEFNTTEGGDVMSADNPLQLVANSLSGTIAGDAAIVNTQDLAIDDLSVGENLLLTVDGSVTAGAGDATTGTNLAANTATITSTTADGSVGAEGKPLVVAIADTGDGLNIDTAGAINLSGQGDLTVTAESRDDAEVNVFGVENGSLKLDNTEGDLVIGTIAVDGLASLTGAANILNADENASVTGDAIALMAKDGSVGTADSPIKVDTGDTAASTLSAAGTNVYVAEISGDLVIDTVVASEGDVVISVPGSITDVANGASLQDAARAQHDANVAQDAADAATATADELKAAADLSQAAQGAAQDKVDGLAGQIAGLEDQIADIDGQIAAIQANPNLTPEEKQAQIDELNASKGDLETQKAELGESLATAQGELNAATAVASQAQTAADDARTEAEAKQAAAQAAQQLANEKLDAANNAVPSVGATGDITLSAGGSIGASDNGLETEAGGTINITAGTGVNLNEKGDLDIGSFTNDSGDVALSAGGDITSDSTITGDAIELNTLNGGNVGADNKPLQLEGNALAGTIDGNANIDNDGDLEIGSLTTAGDLDLAVDGAITAEQNADASANINAGNATIRAEGNIGTDTNPLSVNADSISASGDDMDLVFANDTTINSIIGDDVDIKANGSVYAGDNGGNPNIDAINLNLDAAGDVGTKNEPLTTRAVNTSIKNGTGKPVNNVKTSYITVAVPVGKTLTYNTQTQVGVAIPMGVTAVGTYKAKDIGTYMVQLVLGNGYVWADGTQGSKTITWVINPKKVAVPEVKHFVYDTMMHTGIVSNSAYVLSGTKSARKNGAYEVTAKLLAGYVWADGTTAAKTFVWRIDKNLVVKAVKKSSTRAKLSWTKYEAASGYVVYYHTVGGKKWSVLKTVKANKLRLTTKKLAKNKNYRFRVKAFKMINGKRVYLATSKVAYVTLGKAKANAKKVTVSNTEVSLEIGKTSTINAKIVKTLTSKPLYKKVSKFRYVSTNTGIAKVSPKGVITALKKGICDVYVIANNGMWRRVKVTVI